MRMPPGRPTTLVSLTVFGRLVMVLWLGSVVLGVAAPAPWRDAFDEYVGRFIWVPYLWIAFLPSWSVATQNERQAVVRFARWNLWLAMLLGVVDLVVLGWMSTRPERMLAVQPSRMVGYWVVSGGWLWLLGRPSIRDWVESGGKTGTS